MVCETRKQRKEGLAKQEVEFGKQGKTPRKLSKVQREKQSDVESKDQKMEARK